MRYTYHQYDINISELYFQIKKFLQKNTVVKENFDKDQYLTSLLASVKFTAKTLQREFNPERATTPPIIIPSSYNNYSEFLSRALAFYDIPKINLFLNHHYERFEGNYYADKDNFIGLLEFSCYDMIKGYSLIKTDERLEKITQWIERKREEKKQQRINEPASSNKIKEDAINKNQLIWRSDIKTLKNLSRELRLKEHIEKSTDFLKVFTEQKKIHWKSDIEYLVYLLYCLRHSEYIKCNEGYAYWAVSVEYFYEFSEKLIKKNRLSDTLYNIRVRRKEEFTNLRVKIETILRDSGLKFSQE